MAGAQAWIRSTHLVAAVLLGTPTALLGGYVAILAVAVGFTALTQLRLDGLAYLIWGLAGVFGVIAWVRLTLAYAMHGRAGLSRCDSLWWPALAAGVLAASMFLFEFRGILATGWQEVLDRRLLFMGPLLIPLALHLLWLRFGPFPATATPSS